MNPLSDVLTELASIVGEWRAAGRPTAGEIAAVQLLLGTCRTEAVRLETVEQTARTLETAAHTLAFLGAPAVDRTALIEALQQPNPKVVLFPIVPVRRQGGS